MRYQTFFVQAFLLVCLVALSGCFSSRPEDIEAFVKPMQTNVTAENYILQPPDGIMVYCTKVPEIHQQVQTIRPDGKVTFEALGEIQAAGKTPEELAELLKEKIMLLYALVGDNPVDVRVVTYRSKVYYVLGQVYVPGPKVYTGRDTFLFAIAEAQPNPMAWIERIQVIRPSSDGLSAPKIFEVNLDRMIAHGEIDKNVLLQEGDIIYVPPTVLAAVALKLEEFMRPIGRAFSAVSIVTSGSVP